MSRKWIWGRVGCVLLLLVVGTFACKANAVETANVTLGGLGSGPAITLANGTSNFFLDSGAVDGEFPIRIGPSAADDFLGGVLLSHVSENGRDVSGETIFATANVVPDSSAQSINNRNLTGGWSVSTRRAGIGPIGTPILGGELMNANFGAAYFPFSQGWIGGTFSSSTTTGSGDGLSYGAVDQFTGNGISLSNIEINFTEEGYHKITVPGVDDSRRQGMLFANVADNVGRYAAVAPLGDGSGYAVANVDNDHFFAGDPDLNGEADGRLSPTSFVFIPKGTPGITMATIQGGNVRDSVAPMVVSPSPLFKSGNFTISGEGDGRFRLSIPGQTPSSGTLLLNSAGDGSGQSAGTSSDNVVSYQADGNDWIILSQDPESNSAYAGTFDTPLDGTRGQQNATAEAYFSFAFIPNDGSVVAPAAVPSVSSLTNFSTRRVIGWNAQVVDYNGGNNAGDMSHEVVSSTSDVVVESIYSNRGDNAVAVDGAFLSNVEGVLFATIREGFRDNSSVGGLLEYGVIGVSDDFGGPDWKIHTAIADPANGEHNIDYAAVYFGSDSGFELGQKIPTAGGVRDNLAVPGVGNSNSGGALFLTPHGNDDNFITATPDGSGWDVRLYDNGAGLEGGSDQFNYVYLPYDANNLVAGQVNADGSLVDSTDPSGFTLTKEFVNLPNDFDPVARPAYRLSVAGKTPDDGMLLLTSVGDLDGTGVNLDNSVIYLADGNDFLILGLDHRSSSDPEPFVIPEDTAFYFAYIDFDDAPFLDTMLVGDFDGNGLLNLADIDALTIETAAGNNDASFDLTGDGFVDSQDITAWLGAASVENGLEYRPGDANLNGAVGGDDFTTVASNFGSAGPWSSGNFDGDASVGGSDFTALASNFGFTSSVSAVPEPAACTLSLLGMLLLLANRRVARRARA